MSVVEIHQLETAKQLLATGERILALDFGRKRVGVAVSDPLMLSAHGRETIQYTSRKQLFEKLREVVTSENIGLIVVGLPRNMDGSEGGMVQLVRTFIDELRKHVNLAVIEWDERLSSRQAQRALEEMGIRLQQQRQHVDRVAAIFILQNYLASLKP